MEDKGLAVVTGATSGIGLATARALAKRGYPIAMSYHSATEHRATEIQQEIERISGQPAYMYPVELSSQTELNRFCNKIKELHQRISILVNNAGMIRREPFLAQGSVHVTAQVMVHLVAPMVIVQKLFRILRPGATLIFIGSRTAHVPEENTIAYGAAKAGIESFASNLSIELPTVRPFCVIPPITHTGMVPGGGVDPAIVGSKIAEIAAEPEKYEGQRTIDLYDLK